MPLRNFQHYLPQTPEAEPWGLAVTAGGKQICAPHTVYPPRRHPSDHMFNWEKGRVLTAFQIVLITAGRGVFESRETGRVRIESDTALLLLPGVWHRYAPDRETGWTEQWIELQGEIPRQLQRKGVLDAKRASVPIERAIELSLLLDQIHAKLGHVLASSLDPERAALGLQALALIVTTPAGKITPHNIASQIARAESRLAESVHHPPEMPALAREVGMAYSYFRREFKKHTGLAPYQYLQQLRLEKARRTIENSDASLQSLAELFDFASAYHLSAAFKKHFGISPSHLRRKNSQSVSKA